MTGLLYQAGVRLSSFPSRALPSPIGRGILVITSVHLDSRRGYSVKLVMEKDLKDWPGSEYDFGKDFNDSQALLVARIRTLEDRVVSLLAENVALREVIAMGMQQACDWCGFINTVFGLIQDHWGADKAGVTTPVVTCGGCGGKFKAKESLPQPNNETTGVYRSIN